MEGGDWVNISKESIDEHRDGLKCQDFVRIIICLLTK